MLVDANDAQLGSEAKLPAHQLGLLHRAFSVFLFDPRGRLLLQRRAAGKYHSGGLWTNTCCSHPRPGEAVAAAARRRLRQEMGIDCPLEPAFQFVYCAALDHGLTEHEYDHVLVGRFQGEPAPDPAEVDDWRWAAAGEVLRELEAAPERFTVWFRIAIQELQTRGMLETDAT